MCILFTSNLGWTGGRQAGQGNITSHSIITSTHKCSQTETVERCLFKHEFFFTFQTICQRLLSTVFRIQFQSIGNTLVSQSPLVVVGALPVGRAVTSFFPIHLVKFCLNSGVSAPSRTVVTWVQLGYFFCWIKSCAHRERNTHNYITMM